MVAEKVLGFEIPVKIILFVHVGQALECLKHDIADNMLREQLPTILHDLKYILIQVLKHKVQGLVFKDDFLQIYDVGVRQLYQRLHLLLVHAGRPLIVALLHLLDRHNLARLPVHGLDDRAVGAVSDYLHRFILIHFSKSIPFI